jgi:hypothetical protein
MAEFEFQLRLTGYGKDADEAFTDLLVEMQVDPAKTVQNRSTADVVYRDLADPIKPEQEDHEVLCAMIDWGSNEISRA